MSRHYHGAMPHQSVHERVKGSHHSHGQDGFEASGTAISHAYHGEPEGHKAFTSHNLNQPYATGEHEQPNEGETEE